MSKVGDDDAGLARVQELRQAIARFRGKGKFAIGFAERLGGVGDHFADYYLASALDQIWLQPSGGFSVMGLAVETPFLRSGLDKLGVRIEGGKRWEFKSAPESFTETGYTPAARENLQQLIDGLYAQFIDDVSRERKMSPAKLRTLIDAAPFDADRARRKGWSTSGLPRRRDGRKSGSAPADRELSPAGLRRDDKRPRRRRVVPWCGARHDHSAPARRPADDDRRRRPRTWSMRSTRREAKEVKAIVLRIDSPGGTYPRPSDGRRRGGRAAPPASRRGVELATSPPRRLPRRGAADVIGAEPTTITARSACSASGRWRPSCSTTLGVHMQRVGIGANAGMYSTFQSPTPQQRRRSPASSTSIYADFTRQVGEARKLDAGRLDAAARGRVFTGVDAGAPAGRRAGGPAPRHRHRQGQGRHRRSRSVQVRRLPARERSLAEGRRRA
jgi:protease-4